jgi:pimeloyl-ACP methyl ester carboxylesterase
MRGYGESDKPQGREHYIVPKLAADVAGIIKARGHDKCEHVATMCLQFCPHFKSAHEGMQLC